MEIPVSDEISLGPWRPGDKPALVQRLNDEEIHRQTLRIPFPYTEQDADEWLQIAQRVNSSNGVTTLLAVRDAAGEAIGGIGLENFKLGVTYRCEIGYWLARSHWGRGIMTDVLRRLCRYAFEELDLLKLTANVFVGNDRSAAVLVKCGFTEEGLMRQHYRKDGVMIDARAFGLPRADWQP